MSFINLHFRRISKIAKWLYVSFCPSVRPFIRMPVCTHVTIQLPPEGFSLNLKFGDFFKSVENIQVRQKSDKSNGYCTWGPIYIYNNTLCIFRLGFVTATRYRWQLRISLWRVRNLWKLGYRTAVWWLLRKQQEKIPPWEVRSCSADQEFWEPTI
jgi:hypothetical protein